MARGKVPVPPIWVRPPPEYTAPCSTEPGLEFTVTWPTLLMAVALEEVSPGSGGIGVTSSLGRTVIWKKAVSLPKWHSIERRPGRTFHQILPLNESVPSAFDSPTPMPAENSPSVAKKQRPTTEPGQP